MISPTLWITDRLPALWRWLGVNYPQLRAILTVKLLMHTRRPATGLGNWRKASDDGSSGNGFWKAVGLYALMGAFASAWLAIAPREAFGLAASMAFSYMMIACGMTLIADFSTIVLDTTDNQIMLFRPVDGRTMLAARIVHVTAFVLTIALGTTAIGMLIVGARFGLGPMLAMLGLVLLSAVLMVFFTNLIYLLLMQFLSAERLREIINYVQIVTAIALMGGYQILPRLIEKGELQEAFVWESWHLLLPPMWPVAALDLFVNQQTSLLNWLGLGLIVVVPLLGLDQSERTQAAPAKPKPAEASIPADCSERARLPLPDQLASWFTRGPLERAAFTLIWHLTGRDRKFKLKTYPSLGFGLVYIFMSNASRSGAGAAHLFPLYFGSFYLLASLAQIAFSDNYKAAWLYTSAPVGRPGALLSGSFKALIIKLMLPYYTLIATFVFYQKGASVLPDVLLALAGSLLMLLINVTLGNRYLPFSMPPDAVRQNTSVKLWVGLILASLVGFGHWGLTYVPYGVWVAIPVVSLLTALLLRNYRRTPWEAISVA
jgi:ABC-2 type transport system permease protein